MNLKFLVSKYLNYGLDSSCRRNAAIKCTILSQIALHHN